MPGRTCQTSRYGSCNKYTGQRTHAIHNGTYDTGAGIQHVQRIMRVQGYNEPASSSHYETCDWPVRGLGAPVRMPGIHPEGQPG